eukprot:1368336-Prymnesium_polylepis.1
MYGSCKPHAPPGGINPPSGTAPPKPNPPPSSPMPLLSDGAGWNDEGGARAGGGGGPREPCCDLRAAG